MLKALASIGLYGITFISLVTIDYILGNGFIDMIQKLMCKIAIFVKKTIPKEGELPKNEDTELPFHIPTLLIETVVLIITRMVLNRYTFAKGKDRLDELLNESREALRLTDEFIEKWRMRRVPTDTSYLDDEPQEIKPLKLEVPILHMAIIDTRRPRKQIERGEAGDTLTYTDSAILSVVSLAEQDSDPMLVDEVMNDEFDVTLEMQNRFLWDVEEEDPNVEY